MASGTLPNVGSGAVADRAAQNSIFEAQLDRTRRQVRFVEFATVMAGWLAGLLACLMVVALIDHWILALGVTARWMALALLVVGSALYAWKYFAPLLLKRINPVYAAQAIEHAQPTLKNSLINFLLLRTDSRGVKEGIMQAVERQAASDITKVPVDLAVDRSQAIRLGYVLVGILAATALYKIVSPKDPFQTAARVFAPWASIARPARVQITNVEPGHLEVYQGQSVTISATLHGLRAGEEARVLYSSDDGRVVDRAVPMTTASDGIRVQCTLPSEAESKHSLPGIQQNLEYRIVAGDATSDRYRLQVRPVPTMFVERVDYQFPAYTKRTPQTQEKSGDIQAVEGARVTIHGRANQAVTSATLEFDPPMGGASGMAAETLSMQFDGERAWASFTLELKPDRRTPKHASYQLRFYNDRGERSEQPTLHRIEVLPDLPPEVQILSPAQAKVEVPLDGEQTIEVRAIDPDFGLAKVGLRGTVAEKLVLEHSLLNLKEANQSQGTFSFALRPAQLGLKAGDELHYWAWVEDGRQSPQGAAEPNQARTSTYLIVVTAPQKPANGDATAQPNKGNDSKPTAGDNPRKSDERRPGEAGNKENKPGEKESVSNKPSETGDKPGEKSEDKMGDGGSKENSANEKKSGDKGGSGKQQKSEQQSGGKKQGNQGGNEQEAGASDKAEPGAQGGAAGKGNQKGNDQGEAGGDASGSESGKSDGSSSGDKQSGSGGESTGKSSGNKSEKKSGEPGSKQSGGGDPSEQNGVREAGGDGGEPTAGKPGEGSRGGSRNTKPQHDGEAFERILERMKEQEKEQGQPGDKPAGDNEAGRQEGNAGAPGENSKPSEGASGKQPNDHGNAGQQSASARKPDGKASGKGENTSGGATGDPKPDLANDPNGKQSGEGAGKEPKQDGAGAQKPDSRQGGGGKQKGAPGEGGNPQNADRTDQGSKPNESGADQGEQKDPGMGDNGSSGAGQNSKDKTGSGQGTEANRDKPKSEGNNSSQPMESETSAASGSKKQSDSKGGESGDQSGGGGKGAGQSGKQEGNDSAGSKSSADQGAGKSAERGSGETGPKGGQEQKSDGQTGAAGKEPGKGSSSKPGGKGNEPGGTDSGEGPSPDNAKASQATERGKQRGNGPVNGGGIPDDGEPENNTPAKEGTTPDGEAANLNYAKKATDLALDYLKDQEHNPDPELLKRLGWTPEELQEFVRRWESLQKSADKNPMEKRELDEALHSLGLRAPRSEKRAGGKVNDNLRDLRDTGGRTQPPSKYREQFDAFRKGKK